MDIKTALVYGYQTARSTHFAGQQLTLPLLERIFTGRARPELADSAAKRREILGSLRELLREDSANIARGIYPIDVLKPESPIAHWKRFGRIVLDGWNVANRKRDRNAHDFDASVAADLAETPEYYRRNFHFQTGGYFTENSAELYEHQVEILFAGGADAMRRLIVPMFKEKFPGDGEGLRFLEVAAGTGPLTRFMKLAYPKARFTVSDLSWAYLKKARANLANFDRVEFVQAPAEKLPFRDGVFDGVFSCFLFHELPRKVRAQALAEAVRALKPGGAYGFVDALQAREAGAFGWALDGFPRDFHEPFFKDYQNDPVEELMVAQGLRGPKTRTGFLAKAVLAEKELPEPGATEGAEST